MNKDLFIARVVPVFLAAVGVVALAAWLKGGVELEMRMPGGDGTPEVSLEDAGPALLEGTLVTLDGAASELSGSWPRFRGANIDAISTEKMNLSRNWGDSGPAILWSLDLGEGYAGVSILNGRVYLLDYDQENEADLLRCLSLDDGKDIWQYSYPVKVKRWHGMSRTVPAVTDGFVVAMGPRCHVTCLDAETGEFVWMMNLVREYGTTIPQWHAGQCPLIEDGRAIIAPAGVDVLMVAVDCATGEVVWETENPHGWDMTHSSIIPIEFAGKRMYVYCAGGGMVGVSSDDGSIVWETDEWTLRTNVPSPVPVGDGKLFLSAGYNKGSMMLQLKQDGEAIVPEVLFSLEADVFGSAQQTPVFYNDYIYGVRPDQQFVCLDLDGNVLWTSTSATKFGIGPYTVAGGMIYAMDDEGLLRLIEAGPGGYRQIAEAKVLAGHESWAPMAIASGRLIARDLTHMVCLDVSEP